MTSPKKMMTVTLLSVPTEKDRFLFMRQFIANIGGRPAYYKNLVFYQNRTDRLGVFGNYEFKGVLPFDHDYEKVVLEILGVFANDEQRRNFGWVIENRGVFSPQFLEGLQAIARVRRHPQVRSFQEH